MSLAGGRPWGRLDLGRDAGGPRWFLVFEDGRRDPVHAGSGLELRLGEHVVPVGFEASRGEARLTLPLGEDVDRGELEDPIRAPRLECRAIDGWHAVKLRRPAARGWRS